MTDNDLYFIYLGKSLPKYAIHSIKLAKNFSGLNVVLIGNKSQEKKISKLEINFVPLESFYSDSKIKAAKRNLIFDKEYRNEFWVKTLERLFVLEQFMKWKKIDRIFHAELDQILFRADILLNNLNGLKSKGIFLPFHDQSKAIASVFYCNDLQSLNSLLNFALSENTFSNEMELIAKWSKENLDKVSALPTALSLFPDQSVSFNADLDSLSILDVGGIVDAAQVGQWIFGEDPRNIPILKKPATHFVDEMNSELLNREQLSSLKFEFLNSEGLLLISSNPFYKINLFNVHVHSKIHRHLSVSRNPINKFLKLANSSSPLELYNLRLIQISYFFKTYFLPYFRHPFTFVYVIAKKFNQL